MTIKDIWHWHQAPVPFIFRLLITGLSSRSNRSIVEDIRGGEGKIYGAELLKDLLKLLPDAEEVRWMCRLGIKTENNQARWTSPPPPLAFPHRSENCRPLKETQTSWHWSTLLCTSSSRCLGELISMVAEIIEVSVNGKCQSPSRGSQFRKKMFGLFKAWLWLALAHETSLIDTLDLLWV